jgi:uncharacterized protein (DUF433 family)
MTGRLEVNPAVVPGKPVIPAARLPIELLPGKVAVGTTTVDVLDACPRLRKDDIRAALAFAADRIIHETVVTLGTQ